MKRFATTLLFAAFVRVIALSALQSHVEVYQFRNEGKPYVEVFFYILGSTVDIAANERGVEIMYHFTDSSGAAVGDKYNLINPRQEFSEDFMDLRRHYLRPGTYAFYATITDLGNTANVNTIERTVVIETPVGGLSMSDVQLLASADVATEKTAWSKYGRQCIPLPYNYYPDGELDMLVFAELYDEELVLKEDFFATFAIQVVGEPEVLLQTHKRLQPGERIPVFKVMDLSRLSTGRYNLSLAIYNKEKELLVSDTAAFIKHNPAADSIIAEQISLMYANSFAEELDADSLQYVLKAMLPIVSSAERQALNDIIKKEDIAVQRQFVRKYWLREAPSDPAGQFAKYMEVANVVDERYHSGLGYGFETDRGNIFLKYGPPDDQVAVEEEPSAPPYEIWIYYDFPVSQQRNVKFLFYNPSLGNDYLLLHSTAQNEIRNPRWEQILYADAYTETRSGDLIDAKPVAPNWNRQAKRYFEDF